MLKFFTRLSALVLFVALSGMAAKADKPFPKDGSAIVLGEVYNVEAYDSYKATLTPTSSGTLIQDGCPELGLENCSKTFVGFGGSYGQVYSWQVEAGKTYTISADFVMSAGQVCFDMETDMGVVLMRTLPSEGEVISPIVNGTGDILLHFNTAVLYDNAVLCAGDTQVEVPNSSDYPNTIALRIRDAMNSLFSAGVLPRDGGVPVSIEVTGLKSSSGTLYNGDGKLVVNYISSPQLTDMISNNVPKVLKSYYPAGDPEGIWTFVFDRDLVNDGSIVLEISCGNPMMAEGGYYFETLHPQVDGGTLIFDLCDKLRDLDTYIALQEHNFVEAKLTNVHDVEGNLALGGGDGLVGSYDFSLSYNYLPPENLVCEFDPPTGSSLVGVDEIEIWYNNADVIEFEGVEFNYHTENGFMNAVVLKSELSISLENNEMTILCKVPEEVKGHDQITVKLYNMKSIDGNDYRIVAQYDMFVVELLSPIKPGQTIASTGTDDFVFNINLTDRFFYLRYDFYNAEGQEGWVYGSELHKESNGTWTAYNGDFPCYSNFDPYILVSAYYFEDDFNFGKEPAETYKFSFKGTTSPFEYSYVKFVSIDPEPNEVIVPSDDFCFTVTYDGLVNIDAQASGVILGMGMGVQPFAKVEPIYDGDEHVEGYASVWHLYLDSDVFEGRDAIDISIFAKDESGAIVEGNLGAGEFDCMQFSYPVYSESNFLPLSVDPENFSTVNTLSVFTLYYPGKDVSINYSYTDDVMPRILDENFNVIAEYGQDAFVTIEKDGNFALQLNIDPIITPGSYMLMIPENYLLIGEQFDVNGNETFFGDYTVSGSDYIEIVTSEDLNNKEIYNLQGIRVPSENLRPGLYIISGKKLYIK